MDIVSLDHDTVFSGASLKKSLIRVLHSPYKPCWFISTKKITSSVGLGVFRRGFFEDGAYHSLWLAAPSYCAAVQATPPANSGGSSSCLTVLPATLLPEPNQMLRLWLISYRTLALDAYTGGCRQLFG